MEAVIDATANLFFYDATTTFERAGAADDVDRALGARLIARQGVCAVRLGPNGLAEAPTEGRAADAAPRSSFAQARERLLAPTRTAPPAVRKTEQGAQRRRRATAPIEPPPDAILLKVGLGGFDHPHLAALLDRRPDLRVAAALRDPWELDFPEFVADFTARAARSAWTEITRRKTHVIALDDAVRARTAATRVGRLPSAFVGAQPAAHDRDLAEIPFMIQVGPIERRANTLLLLQIWRELARADGPAPLLVLVGDRGEQVDEIAPMLDWGASFNARIVELGPMNPDDLRRLAIHARALLAPDFAAPHGALVRDACALGIPVIASDIPAHAAAQAGSVRRLSPLAGRDWLQEIRATAQAQPRGSDPGVALADWSELAAEIHAHLAQL